MLNSKRSHLARMLLAGFACALSAMACGQVSDESMAEDIQEDVQEDDQALESGPEPGTIGGSEDHEAACFHVGPDWKDDVRTNGKNITHIFVDIDEDKNHWHDADDIIVMVDGKRVTHLKTNGGPCKNIERDVWFPVPGNQDEVEVCICSLDDYIVRHVSVGAKAGGRCFEECK